MKLKECGEINKTKTKILPHLFQYIYSSNLKKTVEFGVLTAVVMKNSIFWDIASCSPLKVDLYSRETHRLHLPHEADNSIYCLLRASFLFGLLFNPEVGGEMLLRNVPWLAAK
jgi:hypothetical protein